MARSMIGDLESPPEWLRSRPGMVRTNRGSLNVPFEPTRVLTGEKVVTLRNENPTGCGCLVDNEDGGHFDGGAILNPDLEYIGTNRVALLYENLMFVGPVTNSWMDEDLPRIESGSMQSMWWARTTLDVGWYDNQGNRANYDLNPAWLADGTEVMPVRVPSGSRVLGRLGRRAPNGMVQVVGPQVLNDRGLSGITDWTVDAFIVPVGMHRPSLPPEVVPTWTDPLEGRTHEQKIALLNERFTALTEATIAKAKDEDWCENYEEASERMGLAESDYQRRSAEPVTYEVTLRLTYSISAASLDSILYDQFGGNHDVRDSIDVESLVQITATQEEGDDFDEESHDIDDLLESAGYTGYDEAEVDTWRTV